MNAIIGDNGIITKAQEAKKMSDKANDEETLKLMVIENMMNEDGTINVGRELFDRVAENGNKWNIVVEKETGKVYGTGCRFVPKGTILPSGDEATTNWIIDEDGKMKELPDDTFTELDYTSTLGVTKGLVFNMDASNIEKGSSSWGNGITLRYYDKETYSNADKAKAAYQEEKNIGSVSKKDEGYDRLVSNSSEKYFNETNMSLTFDGSNYVEINREEGFDFSKGLTFEFYGNIKDYICPFGASGFLPFLGLWDGSHLNQAETRFGIQNPGSTKRFLYTLNAAARFEWYGDWGIVDGWNQVTDFGCDPLNNDIYVTLSLEVSSEKVTQNLYVNGTKVSVGALNVDYYNFFLSKLSALKWLDMGRCTMRTSGQWFYLIGDAYAIRLYDFGLGEEDVMTNYDKTLAYRSTIKK